MKHSFNLVIGSAGLLALAGCKAQQSEQPCQPNVIYVFPDQYRNQAMEFWGQEGFREHVNFRNDPVHTPRLNDFARESVVLTSAQDLDRLVTVYRAALRSGRAIAVDLYTAEIAAATGRDTIPHLGEAWPQLSTFVTHRQRVQVKTSGQFTHTTDVRDHRIFEEDLTANPGGWVLYGAYQSMVPKLLKSGVLNGGCVVWSLWNGYLDEPRGAQLQQALADAGVPLLHHHTSGHASPADLRRLAHAINATTIVPIHTEAPDWYAQVLGRAVTRRDDGVWWSLKPSA